ncbi:hypothetical protein CO660_05355 [Rhizobium sp. L9]|nr:hypothetical protein CO660_05355 [Rhizobium sp. L9]
MLFIAIGVLIANAALAVAVFALRDGQHTWVLTLIVTWYSFATLALIATAWLRRKNSTLPVAPSD